jgi:hypothetical protein
MDTEWITRAVWFVFGYIAGVVTVTLVIATRLSGRGAAPETPQGRDDDLH